MTEGLLTQLTDFGALGLFAAFLIWLYVQTQRRNEAHQKQFSATLDKINSDYDARIEAMRERYGKVISELREDQTEARRVYTDNLSNRLEQIEASLRGLETSQKIKDAAASIRKNEPHPDVTGEIKRALKE